MSGAGPDPLDRFATARLAAEKLHARDLEDLIALHLDPEVSRYLGGVRSAQTTKTYLATNLAHWDRHGFGLWTLRTPAGAFVGRAGVRCVEVEGRPEVEIAYALGRSFWGRGLASEIAEALTTIGLERLKLPSLVGIVMVEHAASHRVLEKAGYTPEGVVVFHDADCVAHRRLRDQRPDPPRKLDPRPGRAHLIGHHNKTREAVMADGEHGADAQAKFTAMENGTREDWVAIGRHMGPFQRDLSNRVLTHLKLLDGDYGGYPVDRLEHSVQTATRAHRAGMDEEYVVCALLHDIGDTLGSANHADVGAAILKPYVSEQNHWMVEHHGIFQGYYFFDYLGLDRNMREQYRGHPWFEYTAQFCHLYDQSAFDPAYESMPLSAFEPMVQRVFSTVKRSIYRKPEAATA